ncbi:MAG: hypothetical protein HY673_07125 [Chloroflexi bacterium]|nr:hypothetical protein [Chloroflexota bacterium]
MRLPRHSPSKRTGWFTPGRERNPPFPGQGCRDFGHTNGTVRFISSRRTRNDDLPDTIVGFHACKGLVQIEKYEAAGSVRTTLLR